MSTPAHVAQLLARAVDFHRAGRLDEAETAYRSVLSHDARNGDALNLLGLIAQARGLHEDALTYFDRAIAVMRRLASAHYNKANVLAELRRWPEAIKAYRKAVDLKPDYADARLNLGVTLRASGDLKAAIMAFRAMVAKCPKDERGHFNLGRCLAEAKDADLSEAALAKALALKPQYVDALITLAKLYAETDRLPFAIETIQKAIVIQPNNATALTNLGTYLAAVDDHVSALEAYERALASDPSYKNARVNRGFAQLVCGQLADGWESYADRAESDGDVKFRKLDLPWPRWAGEPLAGKRIFVWGEQGLGDEILYAGMIPDILREAAACTVGCSPRLVALFQRSFPTATVASLESILNDVSTRSFDYQVSSLDIGRWRRKSFSAFPNRQSYLSADPQAVAASREVHKARSVGQNLIVGFSWRSFAAHVGDQKTLPLETWKSLFDLKQADLVSLQYGAVERLATDMAYFRTQFGRELIVNPTADPGADLDALAAQLQAMDLVITVSNTTAHLSAALGVPTWVVVPAGKARLWYWFKAGAYNPWYPSLRCWRWDDGKLQNFDAALRGVEA